MIRIGGVEEIDALLESLVNDAPGSVFIGFAAKHHCAQAQGRYFQGATAQITIVHEVLSNMAEMQLNPS
jgi:hypothetical protein